MANQLLTISMITNEALAVLENELTFTKFVNRQYDDSFAKSGAKIGNTLNIRKPPKYVGRTGQALAVEDAVETSVPLTLTTQRGVDIQFSSADLALSIDDFSNRFIRPALVNVANAIDRDGLTMATNAVANSVGAAGTPPTKTTVLTAAALLDENACPRSTNLRSVVWSPRAQANMVDSLTGLFNAPDKISEQYNTGTMGKALGFKNSMDQNVVNRTVGPLGGTPTVNGAGQTGSSVLTSNWTATGLRLNQGDVITIAGVGAVNPVSKQQTGQPQNFVVTGTVTADANGNAAIPIYPPLNPPGTAGLQNISASPANNAAITVRNTAGALVSTNLAFHQDAFALACADLPLPGGTDMAARKSDPQTGLSVRMIRQYNIQTDTFPCRLDVLYGWAPLYPEWAVRIDS